MCMCTHTCTYTVYSMHACDWVGLQSKQLTHRIEGKNTRLSIARLYQMYLRKYQPQAKEVGKASQVLSLPPSFPLSLSDLIAGLYSTYTGLS